MSHHREVDLLRTRLLCERPLDGGEEADRHTVLAALVAGAAWLLSNPAHLG
jgi:hypothetical protein